MKPRHSIKTCKFSIYIYVDRFFNFNLIFCLFFLKLGGFYYNKQYYYIEPYEDAKHNKLIYANNYNKANIKFQNTDNNDGSRDDDVDPFKQHIFYRYENTDNKQQNTKSSCILLGI